MKYKCISADSHLEIRPDRYAKRVPAKNTKSEKNVFSRSRSECYKG
jgi:hypothetical protein